MNRTAQANSRQIAYAAGCRAGMDPPEPFVVPSIYAEWADEWERGYRDICTATGIYRRSEKVRPAPKAQTPELTSLEEVIPATPALARQPKPKKSKQPVQPAVESMVPILEQTFHKEYAL